MELIAPLFRLHAKIYYMKLLLNAFRGFMMALADSVPGVSGGTIAFILGFYDKFINSLDALVYGKKSDKLDALKFLAKLGLGWVIGMGAAVLVLANLFESQIYAVSSLFLGFIIFAIPFIVYEERNSLRDHYGNLVFLLLGIAVVSLVTYFNPVSGGTGMSITSVNLGLIFYIFLAGMIAISSMILPGISGSTLLLIFGLYLPIITGVKDLLHFDFSYLPALIVFGLGVIAGAVLVIKFIKLTLEKYRPAMIYLILGLMLGSLYAIVMGPTTLSTPVDPLGFSTFSPIFFLLGGLIILGLEWLKSFLEKKSGEKPSLEGPKSEEPRKSEID